MTLQEILKAKGLSDDDIQGVIGEMKQNKIFTAGEENLDIRYGKLKTDFDNLTAQHKESSTLIEQLKAGTKNSEDLQAKITAYESQVGQLQEQLKQTQLDAAIKVALLGAKATDIDYMTFKLKEKGELELTEDGKIKGIDDKLAGLKTQFPNQFDGNANGGVQVDAMPLEDHNPNGDSAMTRAELMRKPYTERAEYARNNPEAYNALMKN